MLELMLRPCVGMQQIVATPYVVALGLVDALPGVRIAWPFGLQDLQTGERVGGVSAHAGYDEEGMFVRMAIEAPVEDDGVEQAVRTRVAAWASALSDRPRLAPLAPVLSDYADALAKLGQAVCVVYPNGKPYALGVFVGIDVWGRATVRLADGAEIDFPPERFCIE